MRDMNTEEKLLKIYTGLNEGNIRTNIFSRIVSKDKETLEEILLRSGDLDEKYYDVTPLQRMSFIFREREIKYCKCGDPLKWRNFTKGYNKSCGKKECSILENNESNRKKNIEKYGTEYFFQTKEFKEKSKKTFIEKYGTENPFSTEEIKNKIKKTNIKKYGNSSWIKTGDNAKKIAEMLKENNQKKRLEKIIELEIPIEIKEFKKGGSVSIFCKKCKNSSDFSNSFFNVCLKAGKNPCLICNPPLLSESKSEIELYEFIKEIYTGKIEKQNRKILNGKEIDIFLPEKNIGFEFNGIYYHSEIFKDKDEILSKKNNLSEMGIDLVTVWEDDWVYKNEIVKSRICNLFNLSNKIYARECQIKEIGVKTEREFLEKNHIQGYVPSTIKIGIFHKEKLVSIMTFGNNRVALGKGKKEGEYELLRFCNSLNTSVLGGASKMFKYFIKKYNPARITSYQNNSWNTGNLYENLGFKKLGVTKQNYFWCKKNIRFNRFNFRKDKLVREGYDPNLTEEQIMINRSYFRIWDMGNIKWEYLIKKV